MSKFHGEHFQSEALWVVMPIHVLMQGPYWLETVRQYIDLHVHETIRVSQLAALANVHPVYFSRKFKESAGVSVLRYVRQRKVLAASDMMKKPSVRLIDVANDLGFADQAHFSRVFRAEFGASPSKYVARNGTGKS